MEKIDAVELAATRMLQCNIPEAQNVIKMVSIIYERVMI